MKYFKIVQFYFFEYTCFNDVAQSIAVIFFHNVLASVITTVCVKMGVDVKAFNPVKELSKFMIIMAMVAIGLNSNVVQLIKTGGKPLLVGGSCWVGITGVSLAMQHIMGIW